MFGDAGYQGVEKRDETQGIVVDWHVAMRPGKRRALDKASVLGKLQDEVGYAMQLRQDSAKSTLVNRLKMRWYRPHRANANVQPALRRGNRVPPRRHPSL